MTLTIAEDVMAVAREISRATGESVGTVISDMARHSLPSPAQKTNLVHDEVLGTYILPPIPRSEPLTLEFVNRLRDEVT